MTRERERERGIRKHNGMRYESLTLEYIPALIENGYCVERVRSPPSVLHSCYILHC